MACMKLGSKPDAFKQQGQAWFCTTGLPSDITVEVEEMSFHLHKFPLLSKSGVIERLIAEASDGEEDSVINLFDLPGGCKTFELIARFCYGMKLELTAANVVHLLCAAKHLEMTEEFGEGNLISQTQIFLNQVILHNWKDTLKALRTCDDVAPHAEWLSITKMLIESLAMKASMDPDLFGWPVVEQEVSMQSDGGSVWNGINSRARRKNSNADQWIEDVSTLSLPLYKRLISTMESCGVKSDVIAGSLILYAKGHLPGLSRHQGHSDFSSHLQQLALKAPPSEEDQKLVLEEIDQLLPMQKGTVPTKFLSGLLRTAMILRVGPSHISNLERRIGTMLDQASLEDLLLPSFSYSMETLYNVDCVQRMLDQFLSLNQETGEASPCSVDDGQLIGTSSWTPITRVAKLIDGYLAEVASDINLKLSKFQSLAAAIPDYARPLDDGLYRAIDIYLKSHCWLIKSDKERLCRLMDIQKLSLEACTHASQNERLPLGIIVQVLFFEQLKLRNSIAGCFPVSDNLDGSRQFVSGLVTNEGDWSTAVRDNQILKLGMDSMRMRVSELEKECTNMRQEVKKLNNKGKKSGLWGNVSKKFGFKLNSQLCSAQLNSVSNQNNMRTSSEKAKDKHRRHKKNTSSDV